MSEMTEVHGPVGGVRYDCPKRGCDWSVAVHYPQSRQDSYYVERELERHIGQHPVLNLWVRRWHRRWLP